jgi:cytochrome P450
MSEIDLTNPLFKVDPYPTYARLRAEAPVCRVRIGPREFAWLITRYDDVVAALKDERLVKDRRNAPASDGRAWGARVRWLFGPLLYHMLGLDEPDHTRVRSLVQGAFTPRLVESMRSRIESLTEQFLDRVAAQRQMDVIRDYALPLPTTIIADMLGVPAIDRDRFHRWSVAVACSSFTGRFAILRLVPSLLAFLRYIRKLIRLHRDRPENDLISKLVAAEAAGDKLSEQELLAMVFLLLIAGHQTTIHLIGNGTLALLENRAEMERLSAQPSIMPSAVEEMLRYDGPLPLASHRWTRCEMSIGRVTIPPGEPVFAAIASANRDPRQFEHPDVLDLTREPNRHVGFGQGIHHCLGAPLARLEAQIAFTTLLRRFPNLRLAVSRNDLCWERSILLRGLQALPVELR